MHRARIGRDDEVARLRYCGLSADILHRMYERGLLKDPEVLFLEVKNRPVHSFWVQSVVLYLSRLEIYGKSCLDNTEQMQWTSL